MMIDLAKKEYEIDIRKNSVPEQSITSKKEQQKIAFTCYLFGIDRQLYENAVAERINGILKQEFMIDKYIIKE